MSELGREFRCATEPALESIENMEGGLLDIERTARFLQLKYAGDAPDILSVEPPGAFEAASAEG